VATDFTQSTAYITRVSNMKLTLRANKGFMRRYVHKHVRTYKPTCLYGGYPLKFVAGYVPVAVFFSGSDMSIIYYCISLLSNFSTFLAICFEFNRCRPISWKNMILNKLNMVVLSREAQWLHTAW